MSDETPEFEPSATLRHLQDRAHRLIRNTRTAGMFRPRTHRRAAGAHIAASMREAAERREWEAKS